ncbi:MAG: PhzF family phenazine biosynthesis protein [[Eubacterium] sulci]|nr:PhzF family phenazine biosynthesis protein [[Eubacterium] sulci]
MIQYIVDAFADKVFSGNPAAICIMDSWISDELMMNITKENNLSETAFAVKTDKSRYHLRWFTPGGEIDLCGHATLGAAFIIFNYYDKELEKVYFDTLSGELIVNRKNELYEMNFPKYKLTEVDVSEEMIDAIGSKPKKAFMGRDLLCIFDDEDIVKNLTPDLEKVKNLDGLLLQVTAPSNKYDCISRSFAPKLNVPEDPVCGSGHCHIVPFWADELGKNELIAYQASNRGGTLYCKVNGDRITLAGKVSLFSKSEINIY